MTACLGNSCKPNKLAARPGQNKFLLWFLAQISPQEHRHLERGKGHIDRPVRRPTFWEVRHRPKWLKTSESQCLKALPGSQQRAVSHSGFVGFQHSDAGTPASGGVRIDEMLGTWGTISKAFTRDHPEAPAAACCCRRAQGLPT